MCAWFAGSPRKSERRKTKGLVFLWGSLRTADGMDLSCSLPLATGEFIGDGSVEEDGE